MSGLRSAASASDGPWFRNTRDWPVEAAISEAGHVPPLGNVRLNEHQDMRMHMELYGDICIKEIIKYFCAYIQDTVEIS